MCKCLSWESGLKIKMRTKESKWLPETKRRDTSKEALSGKSR